MFHPNPLETDLCVLFWTFCMLSRSYTFLPFAFHTHCCNFAVSCPFPSLSLLGSLSGICLCPSFSGVPHNFPQSPTKPWLSAFQLPHSFRVLPIPSCPPQSFAVSLLLRWGGYPALCSFLHTVTVGWYVNHQDVILLHLKVWMILANIVFILCGPVGSQSDSMSKQGNGCWNATELGMVFPNWDSFYSLCPFCCPGCPQETEHE